MPKLSPLADLPTFAVRSVRVTPNLVTTVTDRMPVTVHRETTEITGLLQRPPPKKTSGLEARSASVRPVEAAIANQEGQHRGARSQVVAEAGAGSVRRYPVVRRLIQRPEPEVRMAPIGAVGRPVNPPL